MSQEPSAEALILAGDMMLPECGGDAHAVKIGAYRSHRETVELALRLDAFAAQAVAAARQFDLNTHDGKIDNLRHALSVIDTRDPDLHRLLLERNIVVTSLDGGHTAAAERPSARFGACPDCQRPVYLDDPPGTGLIVACGRRLVFIEDCGFKGCGTAAERAKPAASDLETARELAKRLPLIEPIPMTPGQTFQAVVSFPTFEAPIATLAAALAEVRREGEIAARAKVIEWEKRFDLFWKAQQRGVELWRAEAPSERELTLPDMAHLTAWLIGEMEDNRQAAAAMSADVTAIGQKLEVVEAALRGLWSECEAWQGPELRDDPNWGPLMRAAAEALGEAPA